MHRTTTVRALLAVTLLASATAASAGDGHDGGGHGHDHGHGHHDGGHDHDHGHGNFHSSFGIYYNDYYNDPFWWGPRPFYQPYYRPYYYDPPTVIVEREPPVYIQRPTVAPAPAPVPATVWYYCPTPAGYYPYVQSCSQQWVSVDPRSVAPPR